MLALQGPLKLLAELTLAAAAKEQKIQTPGRTATQPIANERQSVSDVIVMETAASPGRREGGKE